MSKPRPKQPTKFMLSIVDICRKGEVLCRSTGRDDWFFEPSGRAAPPKSSERCVKEGLLVPRGDGLFPWISQTFGAP